MSSSDTHWDPPGLALVACLFLGLGLGLSARAAEDPLWTAYADGPPARVKLLNECTQHLQNLSATAAKKGPAANWALDPDVRFLLTHRIPAELTIGRELEKHQADPYLAALVWTAARLGHRELLGKLPGALARAQTDAGRLSIIQTLGDVETPAALKSLKAFLAAATPKTPEALVVAACQAIGKKDSAGELPALIAAQKLVHSRLGLMQVAGARLRCGDPTAQPELLAVLTDGKATPELRMYVLGFLANHPIENAAPTLADLAVKAQEPAMAQRAVRALTAATGFDQPYGTGPVKLITPAELKAQAGNGTGQKPEPDVPHLEWFGKMSEKDRKEAVTKILDWWHEHPAAVREAAARKVEQLPK